MRQKRRNFTSSFKTKVVLDALKERETIQQLGFKYEVQPNQISTWKREFLENADRAFGGADGDKDTDERVDVDQLFSQIGQLKVENDFLKKSLRKTGL